MSNPKRELGGLGRYFLFLAVVIGVTLGTGVFHGRLSQRWGPVQDLTAAARHLESLPSQIGDWQLAGEEPIEEPVLRILSCAGYVNRNYVNRQTGETISVAVLVGPAGPIAVHTPEICFSSRAYALQSVRKQAIISDDDGKPHSFWKVTFIPSSPTAEQLRVYYGWCANQTWTASESPRFEFADRPLLFKLQIAAPISADAADSSEDACMKFLTSLLHSGWKANG